MKQSFILFICLFSVGFLQAESLSNGCCGGKKKHKYRKHLEQEIVFTGCGCGGGGRGGSNEIPPDNQK